MAKGRLPVIVVCGDDDKAKRLTRTTGEALVIAPDVRFTGEL